jgi:hypothetical protein
MFFGIRLVKSNASVLLCGSRTESGSVFCFGDGATLGSGIVGGDSTTLGDVLLGVVFIVSVGLIESALFNCVAISRRALRTGSPADNDGVVDDGGLVNSSIISSAACFK